MNRRKLLKLTAGTLAASTLDLRAEPAKATFSLGTKPLSSVPLDFTGLSYESPQLANPGFFSPRNTALVQIFRELAPTGGVLRTGGNLSAFTGWRNDSAVPATAAERAMFDKGKKYWEWDLTDPTIRNGSREAIFTPACIQALAGFLDATGWKLIYGLNFANGSPEQAAAEAACVQKLVGNNLLAFQLGNEIDFWGGGFRPKPWDFDQFFVQWTQWVDIIRAKAPAAPFAGPDTAVNLNWVEQLAGHAKKDVVLLTKHHYAMGPAGDPKMDATHLLGPDPDVQKEIASAQRAKAFAGVGFRNSECNSCYHGGQPGVSNAFASALWGADYMLTLAQGGHAGVNLHGGGDGFYSPITGDADRGFIRQPLYFGMKFAQLFAGATMLEGTLNAGNANLTAYAARKQNEILVALINKDKVAATVTLNKAGLGNARLQEQWKLSAPAIDSKTGVTLEKTAALAAGTLSLEPYSAVILRLS